MSFENPQNQKVTGAESEDAMKGKAPDELETPQKEPVGEMIAADTEKLGALWGNIPEDMKQSPGFF